VSDGCSRAPYVEITATLSTSGIGGVVIDRSASTASSYVALDVAAQQVQIGHFAGGHWVVDAFMAKTLLSDTDYTDVITIRGNDRERLRRWVFAVSFAFNAPVADGALGVLSRSGTTSVDSFRTKTNDPASRRRRGCRWAMPP
jgi:hypothetical protein